MQPENSSFSHLMVVNDESPKTMELSTEDKRLHERFGFDATQASLVSLDLAADSTGSSITYQYRLQNWVFVKIITRIEYWIGVPYS